MIPWPTDPALMVALVVALVTGGAGVVQGVVQGTLTGRSASVGARQEAARAAIEMCDRLMLNLAAVGQAANEYGLRLADDSFLSESDWDRREPFIHKLLTAHGLTKGAVASLPPQSPARPPVEKAMDVCAGLPGIGSRQDVIRRWKEGSDAIPAAFEAVGRERARQYALLEVAARPWWARKRVRGVRHWWVPFTSARREELP